MKRDKTRDVRQAKAVGLWRLARGHGTIEAATGFGKTETAIKCIKRMLEKHDTLNIIVVVPTVILKEQWEERLNEQKIDNYRVIVINTVIRITWTCDLLILDEIHRYPAETFRSVFDVVKSKWILGLTATFERLDEKHKTLEEYAPIVDVITTEECLKNGWVSPYTEYVVVIDPGDMTDYDAWSKEVMEHLEFFNGSFPLALSMTGKDGWKHRLDYARRITKRASDEAEAAKATAMHAFSLMRAIQKRKLFIAEHEAKRRVAEEIIGKRQGEKIITFSATVKQAESFKEGFVYTGKETKKKNRMTLEEFKKIKGGAILNSVKIAEEGMDVEDLSVGIMMSVNSSMTKHRQSRGRVIRKKGKKKAEFFTLILKDTVEVEWWRKYNGGEDVIMVDEENLTKLLDGNKYEEYHLPLKRFASRV